MRTIQLALILLTPLLWTGCADDPVSYSAPIGINMKAKSADSTGGVVSNEKGITTESANPYGAFVAEARRELGRDPGELIVEKAELYLGATSSGVTRLGEVFTGTVEVVFKMNDTDNSYPVATGAISATTTSGPVPLDADFSSDDVSAVDFEKLLGGSFKVIMRGPATAGFSTKGAEAELQVTLTFSAFE